MTESILEAMSTWQSATKIPYVEVPAWERRCQVRIVFGGGVHTTDPHDRAFDGKGNEMRFEGNSQSNVQQIRPDPYDSAFDRNAKLIELQRN